MEDVSYQIAILLVRLHIPEAQSLKQKRGVLKSLKDRARSKFNVSISEIAGQDKWQIATLGFACIGTDSRHMDSSLQNLLSLVKSYHSVEVCEHHFEFL